MDKTSPTKPPPAGLAAELLAGLRFQGGEVRTTWQELLAGVKLLAQVAEVSARAQALAEALAGERASEEGWQLLLQVAPAALGEPLRLMAWRRAAGGGQTLAIGSLVHVAQQEFTPRDRALLRWCIDSHRSFGGSAGQIELPEGSEKAVLQVLSDERRLVVQVRGELQLLRFTEEPPLAVRLQVRPAPAAFDEDAEGGRAWRIWADFGDGGIDLWQITQILPQGLLLAGERLLKIADASIAPLLQMLIDHGAVSVPRAELAACLFAIKKKFAWKHLDLPTTVSYHQDVGAPQPVLYLHTKSGSLTTGERIRSTLQVKAYVAARYGEQEWPNAALSRGRETQPLSWRQVEDEAGVHVHLSLPNRQLEEQQWSLLRSWPGVLYHDERETLHILYGQLLPVIHGLLEVGWELWAEKVRIEMLTDLTLQVEAGLDWFDLQLSSRGDRLNAWQLIHYLKRKSLFIRLGDGRFGVLPEAWCEKLQRLAESGQVEETDDESGRWRVGKVHAFSLEALRQDLGDERVLVDQEFAETIAALRSLAGLQPAHAPEGFTATLRPYQELGLAWLQMLDRLGLGGCLADEMGLGKTVQVLAFFASQRNLPQRPAASLVIAPKSLTRQWLEEAKRLAPALRTTIAAGKDVLSLQRRLHRYDLIFVSYGWVRRHIELLRGIEFHYIVLDEAQAIKNAASATAQAVKALSASRRLALSGTPVENHLGELLSIFAFLNPGLGPVRTANSDEHEGRQAELVGLLRPLILRRLKADVLPDLPEKTVTTVKLALGREQRQVYDAIRHYYQEQLELRSTANTFATHQVFFLEGLLRLRQAACDGDLVAPALAAPRPSGKIDYLLQTVQALTQAGHKVVIFSQFVTFLQRVGRELAAEGLHYCYLDGQTVDRYEVVQDFQTSTTAHIFLVSILAGGVGLNLTAADYCFVLDPWWNPAVEHQAVDRLHRIGQQRGVFVYKLLADDSVEEKIVALQARKQGYADMVGATEAGFLEKLSYEDFQDLFK